MSEENKPVYVCINTEGSVPIGFKISGNDYSYDLLVTFIPKVNQTYYLLYVDYTTGDSENTHRGNIEYVEMYEDFDLADENAKIIRSHYDAKNCRKLAKKDDKLGDENRVNLKLTNGEYRPFRGPWLGYFEHIDKIFVVSVEMNQGIWEY